MKKEKNIRQQPHANTSRPKTAQRRKFFLDEILDREGLYILCGVLLVMLAVLFYQFIFADRLFLFKDIGSDTINFSWPSYYLYAQYLHKMVIPNWTFVQGLGQNIFPGYMGDAPAWLNYLVSPDDMPFAFVYVQMVKIFLSGVFFYLFLKKAGLAAYAAMFGATLYSFCGFMTVGAAWFVFTTEGLYVALLLYGLELLSNNENPFIFCLAVALLAAYNPFMVYLDGLLAVFYLLMVFMAGAKEKFTLVFFRSLFLFGLLGLGVGSFLMFGNIYQMLVSPRVSGNVSLAKTLSSLPMFRTETMAYYQTFLLRMFGNDMAGYASGNLYKGWFNYLESPMQYCGLVSLLLVPQLFVLANKRVKLLSGIALALAVFPVIFPWFRYAFWFFAGDYFRTYSLFFDVLQILLAIKALDIIIKTGRINVILLIVILLVLLAIVFSIPISNESQRTWVALFLVAETATLVMIAQGRRREAFFVLPAIVIVELIFLSWGTFNERDTLKKSELQSRSGYYDYTREAVKYLQDRDKGFYRIQKNYSSGTTSSQSLNDAMIQGYYGTCSYHQFNQAHYVNFLQKMGLIPDSSEAYTRWISGLVQFPLLMELTSVKYLFLSGPTMNLTAFGYDSIADLNNIEILQNRLFMPLGFTYSACISEKEMAKVGSHKDIMMLKAVIAHDTALDGELGDMRRLTAADDTLAKAVNPNSFSAYGAYEGIFTALREDTLQITSFAENDITGNINTRIKKVLFFSIPYDVGWEAKIDGKEEKPLLVNYGFLGFLLQPGPHKIELNYETPAYKAGMGISAVSIFGFSILAILYFRKHKRNLPAIVPVIPKKML